jgi:hypothetical protein
VCSCPLDRCVFSRRFSHLPRPSQVAPALMNPDGSVPPERLTEAARTFDQNSERLDSLVAVIQESGKALQSRLNLLRTTTTLARQALKSGDPELDREEVQRIGAGLAEVETVIDHLKRATPFLEEWHVVASVTFLETFLQDVLSECAHADSSLLEASGQQVSYREVVTASSIEMLEAEMRSKWARGVVDDGGPTRWIKRLAGMGVVGIPDGIAQRLEEALGVRHVVVHRAGIATPDFVRRHPGFGAVVGQPLMLRAGQSRRYLAAIRAMVAPVDRCLGTRIARMRSRGS